MNEATELSAPAWASNHEEIDGAISWERVAKVEIEPASTVPGAPPATLNVVAMIKDEIVVRDGKVTLVRDDRVVMYVGQGDELMTPRQARTLAETILSMVDIIEGGV